MKFLIAPDKFKDALDARAVADAIAEGVRSVLRDAQIVTCPMADGGEGTGGILADAFDLQPIKTTVRDPLLRPREATWWCDAAETYAVVEMAEASGLWLLDPDQRDATRTTSYGTGELLRAAIEAGCRSITLCVGGSATVDGGAGCLQALGWEFLDADGEILHDPMCGEALMRIGECRPPSSMPIVDVRILYDVDNPLLGVQGSARVFAPQKGATPEQVRALEAGLAHWAALLQRSTGRDGSTLPGGGAAGGLPAGLVAAMDARLEPGIDAVCDAVKFERQVRDCDLVLTGEGRLDEQTASGKVVAGVARVAKRYGKRVVALVGAAEPLEKIRMIADRLGLDEIIVITPPNIAKRDALAQTREHLVSVVASYIRDRY